MTHASHGGAISVECDYIDPQENVIRSSTKPKLKTSEFYKWDYNWGTFRGSFEPQINPTTQSEITRNSLSKYRDNLDLSKIVIHTNNIEGNEVG